MRGLAVGRSPPYLLPQYPFPQYSLPRSPFPPYQAASWFVGFQPFVFLPVRTSS